jgi:8-oxo-dGTP pyrophosphatase MutT (NUDIX family)
MSPPAAFDSALRNLVQTNLAAHARHVIDAAVSAPSGEPLRPAAVALTLLADDSGAPAFLLTRRSSTLAHHRGQFALPGGRLDAGESFETAALRELSEELGLALGPEQVLGKLDDFQTRSGFVITPVVVWAGQVGALVPNPHEVARVYRVALRELYQPEVPCLTPTSAGAAPILSLPLVGTYVFSPTAAIIYQLREVALEGRSTRVHHYDQPRFAWK